MIEAKDLTKRYEDELLAPSDHFFEANVELLKAFAREAASYVY